MDIKLKSIRDSKSGTTQKSENDRFFNESNHVILELTAKQSLRMHLRQGVKRSTYGCSSIRTTPVTSWRDDRVRDSWYSSTCHHRLFGIQRSKQPSKPASSELSLLQWSKAWKLCEAYDTSYEWLESQFLDRPTSMGIICLWYITPNDPNQLWRRSLIQYVTMPCVSQSGWVNRSITVHVSTHESPADLATKVISGGMKRDHLVGPVLYDINDRPWSVPPSLGLLKVIRFPCHYVTKYQDTWQ